MDKRKEKIIEEVKENKKEIANSQTWITERQKIIGTLNEIKAREKQVEYMKTQQETAIKEAKKQILFLKEDLFFLLKGKDLEATKKELNRHYDEVKEQGNKIIETLSG